MHRGTMPLRPRLAFGAAWGIHSRRAAARLSFPPRWKRPTGWRITGLFRPHQPLGI